MSTLAWNTHLESNLFQIRQNVGSAPPQELFLGDAIYQNGFAHAIPAQLLLLRDIANDLRNSGTVLFP